MAGRRGAAAAAVRCAAGFVLLYALAVVWEPGQRVDDHLFGAALELSSGPLTAWMPWTARRLLPAVLAMGVALGGIATWARGGRRQVLAAGVVVLSSVLLSPVLRDVVLWRPIHGEGYAYLHNTFPSTHATLVVALVVAIWIIAPSHPRWAGPAAGLIVVVAMLGNVVGHAHRPSDVLGSVLLVMTVTWAVRCVVGRPERARPGPGPR